MQRFQRRLAEKPKIKTKTIKGEKKDEFGLFGLDKLWQDRLKFKVSFEISYQFELKMCKFHLCNNSKDVFRPTIFQLC